MTSSKTGGAAAKPKNQRGAGTFLPASVDGWIEEFGDDFGFLPMVNVGATKHEPGSIDKVEEMRRRVRRGQPLFSKGDRVFHDGSTSKQFESYATNPKYTSWSGDAYRGIESSDCGRYRYRYWNHWDSKKPIVSFIGLNSESKPGGLTDRKLKELAISHGCGGYQMLNLFAAKLDRPQDLWKADDPVGDANDRVIRLTVLATSFTICCWGRIGLHLGRSAQVLWALSKTLPRTQTYCYGLTATAPGSLEDGRKYPYPLGLSSVTPESKLRQMPWRLVDLGEIKRNRGEDE